MSAVTAEQAESAATVEQLWTGSRRPACRHSGIRVTSLTAEKSWCADCIQGEEAIFRRLIGGPCFCGRPSVEHGHHFVDRLVVGREVVVPAAIVFWSVCVAHAAELLPTKEENC